MTSDYKIIKKNLIKAGVKPHLNIFYSIEMGLQGKSWNEITSNEKNEIQKILEEVK
ncbi:MAG: TfoX/Sxy family DNA transformation protein [Bacteroidota bacterium]